MLRSEVAVVQFHHGISVKCSRYRDTGPTDPSLPKMPSVLKRHILGQKTRSNISRTVYPHVKTTTPATISDKIFAATLHI